MKKLITILAVLVMGAVSAETYETLSTFKSYSNEYSYNFKSVIDLEVLKVDIFKKTAKVVVNGLEKDVKLNEIKSNVFDHEFYATYSFVITRDVLAESRACDESEEITYSAVFDLEMAMYNRNMFNVEFQKVEAVQKYSVDICHDFSPKKIKFEYSKK